MTRAHRVLVAMIAIFGPATVGSSSDEGLIRGKFAIQVGEGAALKNLAALDEAVSLSWARAVENQAEVGNKIAKSPYKDATNAWVVAQSARGFTIQIAGRVKRRAWYVSYDPHAPERGLFLLEEASVGSYWDIDLGPSAPRTTLLRAKNAGPGWRVDYEREGTDYLLEGTNDRVVETVYHLKLTKSDGANFKIDQYGK